MTEESVSSIRAELRRIADLASTFFSEAHDICKIHDHYSLESRATYNPDAYWDLLSVDLQGQSRALIGQFLPVCASIAQLARASVLTGPEDANEVKEATKRLRASLQLREYFYSEAEVIHDEGTVLGFRPSKQSDNTGISPGRASRLFWDSAEKLSSVLTLIEASPIHEGQHASITNATNNSSKYLTGTAFIMMWMDPKQADLVDVVDTVRSIFLQFDIKAIRADDIEHEGQITDRVLNEIRTSEFLFADLSGTRPNVYYEVGFAHALGKRVILFRKSGTPIHFDLAGYNCPEYENLHDLKEKLTRRLVSLTNKVASEAM